jgi:hypothetical protein
MRKIAVINRKPLSMINCPPDLPFTGLRRLPLLRGLKDEFDGAVEVDIF